jgi:hypothetical protein
MTINLEDLMTLSVAPKPLPLVIPMSEIGTGDIWGAYADQDNY